jgi:hypothetical protein
LKIFFKLEAFLIIKNSIGNYIGSWRCFAEITGDSCSTLVEQNFNLNELMHRNENGIQNNQNQQQQQQQQQQHQQHQQQQQMQHSSQQNNPASMLYCTPMGGDQPNIRYTQNGSLSKNKGAAWH